MIKFIFCFDGFPYVFAPVFSTPAFSASPLSLPVWLRLVVVEEPVVLLAGGSVLSFCRGLNTVVLPSRQSGHYCRTSAIFVPGMQSVLLRMNLSTYCHSCAFAVSCSCCHAMAQRLPNFRSCSLLSPVDLSQAKAASHISYLVLLPQLVADLRDGLYLFIINPIEGQWC